MRLLSGRIVVRFWIFKVERLVIRDMFNCGIIMGGEIKFGSLCQFEIGGNSLILLL